MSTLLKERQNKITPASALRLLQDGNQRFVMNQRFNRDFRREIQENKEAQFPFACVLSCIDSRVPTSLIFDQGIGDIFSIRIAGNILNEDILGSMEFACKISGSRIIMVLGHTSCGAIKGACDNVELGHLPGLLDKIRPAIENAGEPAGNERAAYLDSVAAHNVHHVMDQIAAKSAVLHELAEQGRIAIVGGMYNLDTGRVEFYQHPELPPLESNQSNTEAVNYLNAAYGPM